MLHQVLSRFTSKHVGIITEQKPKCLSRVFNFTAASGADDWFRAHSCSRCMQWRP